MGYIMLALAGTILTIGYGLLHPIRFSPDRRKSIAGDFGGSAPEVSQAETMYPGYTQAVNALGQKANQLIGTLGTPYGGQLVANLPAQQQMESNLNSYLSSPSAYSSYVNDPMYQAAQRQVGQTLTGEYLTQQSPFEKAVAQQTFSTYLPKAQSQLNQELARHGGMVGSGAQMQSENLTADYLNNLDLLRAQQYNTERQNQLNAVNPATQFAMANFQSPAALQNMLYQAGQPLQAQQQNQLNAAFNEFLRQRNEEMLSLNPSGSMLQAADTYPAYNVEPGSGGGLSGWMPAIGAGLGAAGGMFFGNPLMGAQIGSSLGGMLGTATGGGAQDTTAGLQLGSLLGSINWGGGSSPGLQGFGSTFGGNGLLGRFGIGNWKPSTAPAGMLPSTVSSVPAGAISPNMGFGNIVYTDVP